MALPSLLWLQASPPYYGYNVQASPPYYGYNVQAFGAVVACVQLGDASRGQNMIDRDVLVTALDAHLGVTNHQARRGVPG